MSNYSSIERLSAYISSGGTPSRKKPEYFSNDSSGHLWVKSKELLDCAINETEEHITEEGLKHSSAKYFPADTILIAMYGANVGQLGWLKVPSTVNQAICGIVVDKQKASPSYVYYALLLTRAALAAKAQGAAQQNLNQGLIKEFQIPIHSLDVQQKIGSILKNYDDLIENNIRRIQILEEMAQLIYREWFVHYRFPGHENVRTVDSNENIGDAPEGWVGQFPDFVDFKEGPGIRNWQYRSEGIPFLNIRTLIANDIDFTKVNFLDPNEVKERYQHFLLKEYDHVVSSSGTLGRIVTIQRHHLPLMLNTSIIRMRPKTNKVGKWQLKHFLKSDYFQNQFRMLATGSAQLNFGPIHLKQMFIICPPDKIGDLYEELVSPLEELIIKLVRINHNLFKTRDLLLPKLISGEIDVSDLDIEIV